MLFLKKFKSLLSFEAKSTPTHALLLFALAMIFPACQGIGELGGREYIGRRWHVPKTTIWGYIKKPRQNWQKAKLVVMNERLENNPDRVPEWDTNHFPKHGFDHNFEYKVYGRFTDDAIYDPNSNLILPEFEATNFYLLTEYPEPLNTRRNFEKMKTRSRHLPIRPKPL